jgi:hypothetical protein
MIYVISTSANLLDSYGDRKKEYLRGLTSVIEHYEINPYIIESYGTNYLAEHYTGTVRYSINKGINEFIHIDNFLKTINHKLNDDDDIIKTTLRYQITSPELIDQVKQNTHDVYCKSSADIYGPGDTGVHSFLFSMKYKKWKEFLSSFDRAVHKDYPIEAQLSMYVKEQNTKYLDKLGMLASPANHKRTYSV